MAEILRPAAMRKVAGPIQEVAQVVEAGDRSGAPVVSPQLALDWVSERRITAPPHSVVRTDAFSCPAARS